MRRTATQPDEPPFPHALAPEPDESLLSFMTRVDLANDWPPGSVAKSLFVHSTGWYQATAAEWASGTSWDLSRLAHLTGNVLAEIEALTLLPDVRAATGDPRATIAALGAPGRMRFCPRCLLDDGIIPRFCFLPGVDICPRHEIPMTLACGHNDKSRKRLTWQAYQGPDLRVYPPIGDGSQVVCSECRFVLYPVGDEVGAPPERVAEMRERMRGWEFVLAWRESDVRDRGLGTIREHRRDYPLRTLGRRPSLSALVAAFVLLGVAPELMSFLVHRPDRPCPNAACERYLPPGPDDAIAAMRPVERHCPVCGTRFVNRRLLVCFDLEHGSDAPSAKTVRGAQRRLRSWRTDLVEMCRQDLIHRRRITVRETFRRAGVPLNANLRARRLGLTAIVQDAARRQRLLQDEEVEPAPVDMVTYRMIARVAHEAEWEMAERLLAVAQKSLVKGTDDARLRSTYGILDPVFPAAWALEAGFGIKLRSILQESFPFSIEPLTTQWLANFQALLSGQAQRVPPEPHRPSDGRLRPTIRELVSGDWTDHLPALVSETVEPPPLPYDILYGAEENQGRSVSDARARRVRSLIEEQSLVPAARMALALKRWCAGDQQAQERARAR